MNAGDLWGLELRVRAGLEAFYALYLSTRLESLALSVYHFYKENKVVEQSFWENKRLIKGTLLLISLLPPAVGTQPCPGSGFLEAEPAETQMQDGGKHRTKEEARKGCGFCEVWLHPLGSSGT